MSEVDKYQMDVMEDKLEERSEKKRHKKHRNKEEKIDGLKHRVGVKVVAFIAFMVATTIFLFSVMVTPIMFSYGIFNTSKEKLEAEVLEDATYSSGHVCVANFFTQGTDYLELYCGEFYNVEFQIYGATGNYVTEGMEENEHLVAYNHTYTLGDFYDPTSLVLEPSYGEDETVAYYTLTAEDSWLARCIEEYVEQRTYTQEEVDDYKYLEATIQTTVYVDTSYPIMDYYFIDQKLIDVSYVIVDVIGLIIGLSFAALCALFVFLLRASGYRKGYSERILCGSARIPYEIYTLLMLTPLAVTFVYGMEGWYYGYGNGYIEGAIYGGVSIVLFVGLATLWLMDLVVRISTKTLLSNLIVRKSWKKIRSWSQRAGEKIKLPVISLMKGIPLIWKGLLAYGIGSIWSFMMVLSYGGMEIFMWFFGNVVAFPVIAYCFLMFKKMQLASKALGEGDMSYKIDTKYCVLEYKEMSESLNSIAQGMEVAIEEKMKSERLKTELISNVSHDIKTPLTSIVNYADLISKEETDNQKIHEYSGILLRQADRLKRLTEDLVHASKVTTGNVEVQLIPCDIGVLLNQAIGEYTEKLSMRKLQIVSKIPKAPVVIMADGRHMWRVFDNLLNNICKYAQEGTRVYLTLEQKENQVVIEFKNISKYELDITESELMERFVRGDKSRHSEGNGLGLSIAKSLVEVQNGSMKLKIDGDLFKVILEF